MAEFRSRFIQNNWKNEENIIFKKNKMELRFTMCKKALVLRISH